MPLLQIAQALVGSSDWYQAQWDKLEKLENKPWLILWGAKDQFITTTYLEKWESRLPEAQISMFNCGHFVQEEKTDEVIHEIQQFMEK